MRKLTKIVCSLLIALFIGIPSVLNADDQTGKWGVGGFGGAAIPLGSKFIKDNGETNVDAGGHVRYGMSPHWSTMLAYDNMYFKKDIRVEDITLSALYHLWPDCKLNPFVRFGWGVASGQGAKNFNDLAGIAGLGFEYFALPFFSLGPVVNYHYDSKTGDSLNETHAITAGLMGTISFGGGESKPAMKKEVAAAPVVAAPVDSDGDGVVDNMDKCPASPKGAKVDASGCTPDAPKDSDNDGVIDAQDRCPETPQGTAVNEVGCPQLKPQEKVSIQLNVLFDTGKSVVKPDFDAEVKKVADFMNNYPEVNAVIEGHTDNLGSAAFNTALSQRRAEAVKTHLSAKFGVPASRLSSKGFGPDQPLADNATAEGRAKNRRVVATLEAVKK